LQLTLFPRAALFIGGNTTTANSVLTSLPARTVTIDVKQDGCTMNEKQSRVLLMCGVMMIMVIAVFGIVYFVTNNEEEHLKPLNMTSITQHWFCENGKAFQISSSKIVAACKAEYVDIRQVINHRATIKGIQLTLAE